MAKTLGKNDHSKPTHDEIARRAYTLFEQSGCIPGHDLENWLAAEAQLNNGHKSEAATDSAAPARTINRPTSQETGQRRI
jgi:hypothetical protein